MHVSAWVDASDVLEEISDDQLIDEFKRRKKEAPSGPRIEDYVEQLYYEYRGKQTPEPIRCLVWHVIGRVL